jgi:hypothetical protein
MYDTLLDVMDDDGMGELVVELYSRWSMDRKPAMDLRLFLESSSTINPPPKTKITVH